MKSCFTVCTFLFMVSAPVQAASHELECGDHWFNVLVSWDEDDLTQAEVAFGGDSQVYRESSSATVAITNGDLAVTFTDTLGGILTIENYDGGSTFGMIRETGNSREYAIAPCYGN